ncbi:Dimethylhistidine N-methyltransferase [Acidisarcina polymorpha]|uniref:Dimethylhistidine N-methyltransferase n=1 Tax=Acidisarcina polymorpha TaxID=2211140 RepID=A0A2Z5FS53_9BACT|nr:Dimethylhistidine N-methyltransferase [Acidisarcina polymorpha]
MLRGLSGRPRSLSPWLFYDDEGSRLFEAITELPEYYVTRAEREILTSHADEIIAGAGSGDLTIYELGAGSGSKTGLLLEAAIRRQGSITYRALDVSKSALEEAKQRLEAAITGLTVEPIVSDYTDGLSNVAGQLNHRKSGERRMFLYIGSSIGNFELPHALQILRDVRAQLIPGDSLLLGADLVKDRQILLRAYDDAAGVTAAFNKNVLTRINRELGSNFNLQLFRHRAKWNEELSRIEMHLESLITQIVFIPALDLQVRLARAETIHTENSHKFTDQQVESLLHRAGFSVAKQWKDDLGWFGEYLAVAV